MAAQVAAVRAVSRAAEEPPPLPSGDRPGRPRGAGRRRRGPPGEAAAAGGGKRARLSQQLLAGPGPAEPLPPAALPGLPAAGLFAFSPLGLPPPPAALEERRHHHHRHRPAAAVAPEPGRLAAGQPQKARRSSPADGAAGRPSKRGERGAGGAPLAAQGPAVRAAPRPCPAWAERERLCQRCSPRARSVPVCAA